MKNLGEKGSSQATEYARKKKEQLERANQLRTERNSQQSGTLRSRPQPTRSQPNQADQLLLMYGSLETPQYDECVRVRKADYHYENQKELEQKAKLKYDSDLAQYESSRKSESTSNNPRITASSILSTSFSLTQLRKSSPTLRDGSLFFHSPVTESGIQIDVSDRPILCLSSNLRNEVVVGSADHALYSIDISSNRSPITMYSKTAGHTDWITGVTHLVDGKVLSSSMDGKLCLWETGRRKCVDLFGHQGSITKVCSDMVYNVAISIGYDGKVLVWSFPETDVRSTTQQRRSTSRITNSTSSISPAAELIGHNAPVLECNYHNNGGTRSVLASGDREGKVIIWEVATGAMLARYKAHNGPITAMETFENSTSNQSYFITGGADGIVKLWDSREKSSVLRLAAHANNGSSEKSNRYSAAVSCMATLSDNYIITGGSDDNVILFDIRRGLSAGSGSGGESDSVSVTASTAQCLVSRYQYSRNGLYSLCVVGSSCVMAGDGVGMVLVYDITKSDQEALQYGLSASSSGGVRGMACLEGKLVTAAEDGKVLIYSYS